jgi:hypothetical protein
MTAKAEFELTANDQSAKAAWDRQQNAINAVIARIGKMEEAQNKAKTSQDGFFSKGVVGLASMAAGALTFEKALSGVISANSEMIKQAEQATLKYDEMFRKFNVQSAKRGLEGAKNQNRILNAAEVNAFSSNEASAVATQLVSSGFSADEATGGSLDIMLKTIAASNLQGGDVTKLTESVTQFLTSQGQDLNAENLTRALVGAQRLFEGTNLQLADLSQLAGKGVGFQGRASSQEVLAAFDVGRQVYGADTASTGLKIFGERLMGASEDDQRKDLLKRMKLKPEDVDMIGESFQTVLERLKGGIESLPEEQRKGVLDKFFGGEGAGFAQLLINDPEKIAQNVAIQNDTAGFDAAVEENTSGKAAATRRAQVRQERLAAERDQAFTEMTNQGTIAMQEAGISPFMQNVAYGEAYALSALGFSTETATNVAYSNRVGIRPDGSIGTFGVDQDAVTAEAEQARLGAGAQVDVVNARRPENRARGQRNLAEAMNAGAFSGGHDAAGRDAVEAMRGGGLDKLADKLDQIARNTSRPPVVIEKPAVPKKPASAGAGTGGR